MAKKSKRRLQYEANKSAKVGTEITCPICGTKFVKRQYSQAFCDGKCKDAFWNAKKDRHREGYYEEYDNKHPERKYSSIQIFIHTTEVLKWQRRKSCWLIQAAWTHQLF